MSDGQAPYACDACRSRKIACSREYNGCQRCKDKSVICKYSRSGIIRRCRKRRPDALSIDHNDCITPASDCRDFRTDSGSVQSHLATDIAATRRRLNGHDDSAGNTLAALSSLGEASAAVWHDESDLQEHSNKFCFFESQANPWVDSFVVALSRHRPTPIPPPADVVDHLRKDRPDLIRERGWLVLFYSIILTMNLSSEPDNQHNKRRLRHNLRLALNDAQLFLEPSEVNVHALTLVACHGEEFTTPSLCWMLATNACRMLQTLGINDRSLDTQTRERRTMVFWHLNLLDKGLALIFGRPPTFHKAMVRAIGMPTLDQLLRSQNPVGSNGVPGFFGAHYLHQRLLLTRVMTEIWDRLYEDAAPDYPRTKATSEELERWYCEAKKLLEAAALTEKPFLDVRNAASIDLRLHSLDSTYHYLRVLLTRSCDRMKMQCIDSSKQMLHLLSHMVSEFEELNIGIVWQSLCSPFTPFLELFGEIVANVGGPSEDRLAFLAAMEELPVYLGRMKSRDSLAAKLERIAIVFLHHVRSLVACPDNTGAASSSITNDVDITLPHPWPANSEPLHWDSFFNHASMQSALDQPSSDAPNIAAFDLEAWTSDFFENGVFDWIGSGTHS